jgi:hypothetical protein
MMHTHHDNKSENRPTDTREQPSANRAATSVAGTQTTGHKTDDMPANRAGSTAAGGGGVTRTAASENRTLVVPWGGRTNRREAWWTPGCTRCRTHWVRGGSRAERVAFPHRTHQRLRVLNKMRARGHLAGRAGRVAGAHAGVAATRPVSDTASSSGAPP